MSRKETHIRNMLALYDDAIAAGMTQYDAIRSVIGKTHIKAYFLNVLHEQRSVAWTMQSRFLNMKKDFLNAFLVDYFTDNLHPCPVCGELTPHISVNCCKECSSRNIVSIKKRTIKTAETKRNKPHKVRMTYREIHGEKYRPTPEHVQKIKEACLRKFGYESVFQIPEIRQKAKDNTFAKYNSASSFGDRKVFEKSRKSCMEKYGVPYYSQSEQIKQKRGDNYIYHNQRHLKHLEDYNAAKVRELFVRNGVFYITEFMDYFNMSYTGAVYRKHQFGIFEPNDIQGDSLTEKELADFISEYTAVIRNDRKLVKPQEIDIVVPDYKLAIEYNGLFWHSEECGKDSDYHLRKTLLCSQQGYQLFHIFEDEDPEIWKSMILHKIHAAETVIYARKTAVRKLAHQDIKQFLNDNHIQGECVSPINYGLFYHEELVSVMTFGKPRFNHNYQYELLRFCCKKFTSIPGAAGKLFSAFIRDYHPDNIISYANRRFSSGDIYRVLNFKLSGETKPNYWYCKNMKRISRYVAQKHKLPALLGDAFNPELSEKENMANNGFYKIYDCGNFVFIWSNK